MATLDTEATTQAEALTRALGLVYRLQLHLDPATQVAVLNAQSTTIDGEYMRPPTVSLHPRTGAEYDALTGALATEWEDKRLCVEALVDGVAVHVYWPEDDVRGTAA